MAETEYSTTTRLPVVALWDFVQEMDNWAAFVAGYQEHRKENDRDSVWTLKGDVGVLTRTLQFRVRIHEWQGPERVSFELEGLNEPLRGTGSFRLSTGEPGAAPAEPQAPRKNPFQRLLERILRFFYRRARGEVERPALAASSPGEPVSRMTFQLRLEPGGPMAPMIDAMIQPALAVAAEDLANRILARFESVHTSRG